MNKIRETQAIRLIILQLLLLWHAHYEIILVQLQPQNLFSLNTVPGCIANELDLSGLGLDSSGTTELA